MNGTIGQILEQKRWGGNPGKSFKSPQWARFRLFVQYESGSAKYPSFDYYYRYPNGVKTKLKSEATGLQKLVELAHSMNKKQRKFRYINVFCNLSNELNTVTGDFNYLVCTIVGSEIKWKNKLFWKDEGQMLDVPRIIKYIDELKNLN